MEQFAPQNEYWLKKYSKNQWRIQDFEEGGANLLYGNFLAENCMYLPVGTNKSSICTGGAFYLRSSRVLCPGMMALHWWHAVFEVDRGVVSRYNRPVPLLVSDPLVYELWESLCDKLLF